MGEASEHALDIVQPRHQLQWNLRWNSFDAFHNQHVNFLDLVMPPHLPEHALVTLLRQCFITPRCQTPGRQSLNSILCRSRALHTTPSRQQPRSGQLTKFKESATTYNEKSIGANGNDTAPEIAVLGGGITGLAAAHYLTRELPRAKITIYEGSDRLGGWMKSQRIDVGTGDVVFEQGPRTLRPNPPAGLVTLDIVR